MYNLIVHEILFFIFQAHLTLDRDTDTVCADYFNGPKWTLFGFLNSHFCNFKFQEQKIVEYKPRQRPSSCKEFSYPRQTQLSQARIVSSYSKLSNIKTLENRPKIEMVYSPLHLQKHLLSHK